MTYQRLSLIINSILIKKRLCINSEANLNKKPEDMGVVISVTREGENGVHSRILYNWTNDNKYVRLSATPKNEKQL
jgi:hypothetical protein